MPGGIGGDPPGKVFRLGGTGYIRPGSEDGERERGITVHRLRCGPECEVQGYGGIFPQGAGNSWKRAFVAVRQPKLTHAFPCARRNDGQKNCPVDRGNPPGNDSGLGEPECPSRDGDGERERESPFARLDAAAADKFKGFAEILHRISKVAEKPEYPLNILSPPGFGGSIKNARRVGGTHRATSSGLGEPETSV